MQLQIKSIFDGDYKTMVGSEGLGKPLVKLDNFAADFLSFGANHGTVLHTHPGNHILIVHSGSGWLNFGEEIHGLDPGTCYLVPGSVPHKITADSFGLSLYSVSDNHYPVDSPQRLEVVSE